MTDGMERTFEMPENKNLTGYKLIHEFSPGEQIVSMVVFQDCVYVASNNRVFKIVDDKLVPLTFGGKCSG